MTRRLTFVFAIATGIAVGNLYWSQPLLDLIAGDLGTSTATAGRLVTAKHPDRLRHGRPAHRPTGRRPRPPQADPRMLLLASAALLACAPAPTFATLVTAMAALGLTTSRARSCSLASDLSEEGRRGQTVGTVAAGMLTGILASRTISGLPGRRRGLAHGVCHGRGRLSAAGGDPGWRALPPLEPKTTIRYPALIASVATVALRDRTVRWTLALAAIGFAVFTMFWTSLTFRLSAPPFSPYPPEIIGLFGLAGLAGAAVAQRAGRLHDCGWSLPPRARPGSSSCSPSPCPRQQAARRPSW